MTRNAKTYGIPASAPGGEGFPFMPFLGVDFLMKNSSNNLHISELFFNLSLSHRQTLRALIYTFSAKHQRGAKLSFRSPKCLCGQLLYSSLFSVSDTSKEGGCVPRRHTTHGWSMSVCRRAFLCNRSNPHVTIG